MIVVAPATTTTCTVTDGQHWAHRLGISHGTLVPAVLLNPLKPSFQEGEHARDVHAPPETKHARAFGEVAIG